MTTGTSEKSGMSILHMSIAAVSPAGSFRRHGRDAHATRGQDLSGVASAKSDARATRKGRGFTLIEMLVAVALFSMLIVIFGWVLVQAQRLVKRTTAIMRANTAINAIERVIRKDVETHCQQGFLYAGYRNVGGVNYSVLMLTRTGSLATSSTLSGYSDEGSGNNFVDCTQSFSAICAYALVPVTGSLSGEKILLRASWLLSRAPAAQRGTTYDGCPWYLGDVMTQSNLLASGGAVYELLNSSGYVPDSLPLPVQTTNDMLQVWKYLATGAAQFTVEWTDGTLGGGNELAWSTVPAGGILWRRGENRDTTGTYAFPAALRLTFSLTGDEVAALGANGISFSVVVSLPKKGT
ncbi:MAG: type II secretion system protein [Planctomycetes bacterium]|nr:type II secretion system protein [Planctomycetota bacterium]